MAEKGGEVYIDITAKLDGLDKGLAAAKTTAVQQGGKLGYDFGGKFSEQARGVVGTIAGPMMAAGLAKAAAGVLRSDKALPDAILEGLKTIPFVGAFVDLGSAIYDATFGAADKAAEDLIAKQNAARESNRQVALRRQQEQNAADAATSALMIEAEKLKMANELNSVRQTGDAEAIARKERQLVKDNLDYELQLRMAAGISDAELNALVDVNREKLKDAEADLQIKLANIEKEKQAKAQALAEQRKKEQEQIDKQRETAETSVRMLRLRIREEQAAARGNTEEARKVADERERAERAVQKEKALRDALSNDEKAAIEERFALEQELADVQAQRADAQSRDTARVTTASTALGSFTFDAYPAADQRKVQERTANATERMATAIVAVGFQ